MDRRHYIAALHPSEAVWDHIPIDESDSEEELENPEYTGAGVHEEVEGDRDGSTDCDLDEEIENSESESSSCTNFVTVPTMGTPKSINFPTVTEFAPFEHNMLEYKRKLPLPNELSELAGKELLSESEIKTSSFFKLFFTDERFKTLALNTNSYTRSKGDRDLGARFWREISSKELMIFIGSIIYMGIYKSLQTPQYCTKNRELPIHEISKFMPLVILSNSNDIIIYPHTIAAHTLPTILLLSRTS